jgi:hypothetical protein
MKKSKKNNPQTWYTNVKTGISTLMCKDSQLDENWVKGRNIADTHASKISE